MEEVRKWNIGTRGIAVKSVVIRFVSFKYLINDSTNLYRKEIKMLSYDFICCWYSDKLEVIQYISVNIMIYICIRHEDVITILKQLE